MDPARWKRVEETYQAAAEREPGEREKFLAAACGDDEELKREVESLLAQPSAGGLLDRPAWNQAAERDLNPADSTDLPTGTATPVLGQRVAHYQVQQKLGEGGMGVVYRAYDLKLRRPVALKILPPEYAADPERRSRLLREARVASALNHPNIVAIHEVGSESGVDFIAMELVEGKPLAKLIPARGMPLGEALDYAVQIAAGLAKAHESGVIHRDLKPGNIMLSRDGLVKLLDFGLARRGDLGPIRDTTVSVEGQILGTPSYMSPEQAEGKTVDTRSDIFSFGAVLYEMLTGRRAFQGDNHMSTMAAVLHTEPKSLAELDPRIPRELERIVVRCLKKDPGRRFQNIADLKVALKELKDESDSGTLTPAPSAVSTRNRSRLVLSLSAAFVVLAAAAGWFWWHSKPVKTAVRPLTRLTSNGVSSFPAISPDGKMVAYLSSAAGPNPDIWVQQIGGGQAIQITHEKEGVSWVVFSPDGTQIAYTSHGDVYEVPALGGDSRLVARDGVLPLYTPDASAILFLREQKGDNYLFTVPRLGGTPAIIHPGIRLASYPLFSPDGSQVLAMAYHAGRVVEDIKRWWMIPIHGGNLTEVAPPPLLPGETFAPEPTARMLDKNSGRQWIIFGRSTGDTYSLFRVAISRDGKVTSDPEQLTSTTGSSYSFSVSETGRMVFTSGVTTTNLWTIPIDTDRGRVTGERQSLTRVEGIRDNSPSLSRDGKKVAFFSGQRLVVKDLVTGRETQLVQDATLSPSTGPIISPDGSYVAYFSRVPGKSNTDLYLIPSAGGSPRQVCQECGSPKGFSSDGTRLLTQTLTNSGSDQIGLVDVATGKSAVVLSDPQHQLWNAFYSWDDQWVVFLMEIDNNHFRIYVTPVENSVPDGPDHWIQLTSGEHNDNKPQFSPDGNTVYFTSNRDGFLCIWALRLDPKTRRPQGDPFAIQHFHASQRINGGVSIPGATDMEVGVGRDKIVTNMDDFHSDIWMVDLVPGK